MALYVLTALVLHLSSTFATILVQKAWSGASHVHPPSMQIKGINAIICHSVRHYQSIQARYIVKEFVTQVSSDTGDVVTLLDRPRQQILSDVRGSYNTILALIDL